MWWGRQMWKAGAEGLGGEWSRGIACGPLRQVGGVSWGRRLAAGRKGRAVYKKENAVAVGEEEVCRPGGTQYFAWDLARTRRMDGCGSWGRCEEIERGARTGLLLGWRPSEAAVALLCYLRPDHLRRGGT